ncbi:MAG: type II toxin-antitoxin system RelE/ParE family toxin [Burkholderiales bacterium]|nr:type II toxin-antitoxin system RelE/ParE family toxin [Burkholderiales bacterium]
MSYTVLIKRQAKRKLESLPAPERARIAQKIHQLGLDPDDPALNVQPLVGEHYFRLRVGTWRVIFDRQDELRVVSIERIKPRGDAYK